MENSFKQFAELVTRWRLRIQRDEFIATRVRLTAVYTVLSVIFLCAFSYVLYGSLIRSLASSAEETIRDPSIRAIVLNKASGIIENLILLGDSAVLFVVIFVGFFLTKKTLEPIQIMIKKQNRFIADASHELRTPLAVMKTGIEITLRRKELSAVDARTVLNNMLDEINILTSLSNNLLALSKKNLSKVIFAKIYLPKILENKIERFKTLAQEKNISIKLSGHADKDKYIAGNEIMVAQIFYNLIHNAIQYTENGGSINITYSIKQNKFIVSIVDSGIGIASEHLNHIFEPFYRADNAVTTLGSGLGLSIVKSHIQENHGTIDIKSEINKGTTVVVTFPTVS